MKNIIINNLFFVIIINIKFNNKLYNIKILNIKIIGISHLKIIIE